MNDLFTIGYSPFTCESFISILQTYKVDAIVDIRSSPYSKYRPEFNKKELEKTLNRHHIAYVFLGGHCGARVEDPGCYVNGKADYSLIARQPSFIHGLERIAKGLETYRSALMCAEKDPITCHRMILVARNLKPYTIRIFNILDTGTLESLEESEKRLITLLKLDQPHLFEYGGDVIEEAYKQQGSRLAYVKK